MARKKPGSYGLLELAKEVIKANGNKNKTNGIIIIPTSPISATFAYSSI